MAAQTRCSVPTRESGQHRELGAVGPEPAGARPADGQDEPRPGVDRIGRRRDQPAEQLGRSLVDPVGVVDDDGQRAVGPGRQQPDDGVGCAVPAEPGLDLVHLDRRWHVDVRHLAHERRQRQQVGIDDPQASEQRSSHHRGIGPLDAEQVAYGVAHGAVGEGRAVRLTADGDGREGRRRCERLVDQSGLSDPCATLDQQGAPFAARQGLETVHQRGVLLVAADEGQEVTAGRCPGSGLGSDGEGGDGRRLALHLERGERGGGERGARPLDDGRGGVDGALGRRGHQASSEVDRVTHHRERGAEPHADRAAEHMATVDPDAHRKGAGRVGDPPDGPQHSPVVVLAGGRDPGGQDELAPVLVDVGGEEGDQLLVDGGLDDGDEPVEHAGRRFGTVVLHDPVDARVAHEPDGGGTVLGLQRAVAEVGAQPHRDAVGHGLGRDRSGGHRPGRAPPGLPPPQPPPRPALAIGGAGTEQGAGGRAHHDLARAGGVLHDRRRGGRGTRDHEFAVRPADEEEVDLAAVDADRHP